MSDSGVVCWCPRTNIVLAKLDTDAVLPYLAWCEKCGRHTEMRTETAVRLVSEGARLRGATA